MARRTNAANRPRFPPPARLTVYPAGFTIRLVYFAFEKGACMKKTTIQYILALIACFVVGCGIALGLNAYDRRFFGLRLHADRSGRLFAERLHDEQRGGGRKRAVRGLRLRQSWRAVSLLLRQRIRRQPQAASGAGRRHLLHERGRDRRSPAHVRRPPLHLLPRDG